MKVHLTTLFMLTLLAVGYSQTDRYWSGQSSSNDNIDQGTNWWGGTNPSPGDNLFFNNTAGLRHWPYCNYGGGAYFNVIITYSGANGISWRGDKTYANKFENNNDESIFEIETTISNRAGNDIEINPVGNGGIRTLGNIEIETNKWIKVNGNKQLEISGVISGDNVTFKIFDEPFVILSNINTFSGNLDIDGGIVDLRNNTDPLDVANIYLGKESGSSNAILQIGEDATNVDNPVTIRSGSSGTKFIKYTPTSGTGTFSGAFTLSAALTIDVASGGTLNQTGGISGANNLVKTGSGTLVLSSTQSYSGTTSINEGTLKSSVNLASSGITVSSGATFEATTNNITLNGLTINEGGSLVLSSGGNITISTSAVEPTTSTSSVSLTYLSPTSLRVSWTVGNGSKRILLMSETEDVNLSPIDGVTLNASSVFGSGAKIGNSYVVYNGNTGTSVDVTGLSDAQTYYVKVYEYNEDSPPNYKQDSPGSGSLLLPVNLTSFSANIINKSINLKWQTATEQNNYGFEIERSQKLVVSSENSTWENIGFVNGSGNSNSPKEYSYIDNSINNSGNYSYRLKQVDNNGSYEYSSIVEVDYNPVITFDLEQNYPNPFNPVTVINYSLAEPGFVTIKVYNMLGEEVTTLINGQMEAGKHSVEFSTTSGVSSLTSGLYLYKIQAGSFTQVKKMILTK